MADHSHQITRRPGRPKGGSDRRQIYTAIKDDIPAILKKLTEQALAGDAQSARILLERSIPVVKAGDIHKEIPLASGQSRLAIAEEISLKRLMAR